LKPGESTLTLDLPGNAVYLVRLGALTAK
jgi:hypothetical protein